MSDNQRIKKSSKVQQIFFDPCQVSVNQINIKRTEKYVMILTEYIFWQYFVCCTVSITV